MLHPTSKFLRPVIFAIFSFPLALRAQDYRPGYIIKNNLDSVNGFIVYNSGKKNSAYCIFKEARKSDPVKFTANDLSAYGFPGDKQYLSMSLPGKSPEGKVFLKILAKGAISLYRYRELYLIKKDSLTLLPPPDKKQVETSTGLKAQKDNRYIGLLNFLISECQMTADRTGYAEVDLTNLINNYNRCKGQEPLYNKLRPIAKMNYHLFGGYFHSSMKVDVIDHFTFNPNTTIVGGLGLDISSPRLFDRLFMSFEAWYGKSLYQAYTEAPFAGGTRHDDILMDVSFIKVPLGLRYNFLKENNTPYIKTGISVFLTQDITVKTVTEQETIDGNVFTTESFGGFDLKNPKVLWISVGYDKSILRNIRMFAEFRYERGGGYVGNDIHKFSTMINYNFLLGIRF